MSRLSPEETRWAKGFDEGKMIARGGERWQDGLDPKDHKDRGRVSGWRLQNGLRAAPMVDPYDDDEWGAAPEPCSEVH